MKNFIKTIIITLVSIYMKSSIKPFRNILRRLYLKYVQPKMLENRVVTIERDGIKYRIDLDNFIGVETYHGKGYERAVSEIINKYVKPGMTVLDIGAHIGIHTCRLAKLVGDNGKVIAFEPDTIVLEKLKYNLELNGFRNVEIKNVALSTTCSLDKYEIDKINFIKLDTDGQEYKIIRGGVESIRKFKPVMVVEFCEFTLKSYGDNLGDLIDLLDSLGYSFFSENSLKEYPSKKSILDIYASFPRTTMNVLCLPNKNEANL